MDGLRHTFHTHPPKRNPHGPLKKIWNEIFQGKMKSTRRQVFIIKKKKMIENSAKRDTKEKVTDSEEHRIDHI